MQQGKWNEIDSLGLRLNEFLDCPIKFPGMGQDFVICGHDMKVSIPRLLENKDWAWVKKEHEEWLKNSRR